MIRTLEHKAKMLEVVGEVLKDLGGPGSGNWGHGGHDGNSKERGSLGGAGSAASEGRASGIDSVGRSTYKEPRAGTKRYEVTRVNKSGIGSRQVSVHDTKREAIAASKTSQAAHPDHPHMVYDRHSHVLVHRTWDAKSKSDI